jgi:5-bromo-4-chloroindolyl phosphate hydrolysis protein
MNDKIFEWSLTSLSIIALLWMVLGSVFGVLGIASVIVIGLVVWIVGGGALLYFWGKNYMSRV